MRKPLRDQVDRPGRSTWSRHGYLKRVREARPGRGKAAMVRQWKKTYWVKRIAVVLVCLFLLESMPGLDRAFALAPTPGTQRPVVMREAERLRRILKGHIKVAATEGDRRLLETANADSLLMPTYEDPEPFDPDDDDAMFLPTGQILVSEEVSRDPVKLIRACIHEEIEALMCILSYAEKQEKSNIYGVRRYSNIYNLIFSDTEEGGVIKSYEALYGKQANLTPNLRLNDIVASAFELLIPKKDGLIEDKDLNTKEGAFVEAFEKRIKFDKQQCRRQRGRRWCFDRIFWNRKDREGTIRLAIANYPDMDFYRVAQSKVTETGKKRGAKKGGSIRGSARLLKEMFDAGVFRASPMTSEVLRVNAHLQGNSRAHATIYSELQLLKVIGLVEGSRRGYYLADWLVEVSDLVGFIYFDMPVLSEPNLNTRRLSRERLGHLSDEVADIKRRYITVAIDALVESLNASHEFMRSEKMTRYAIEVLIEVYGWLSVKEIFDVNNVKKMMDLNMLAHKLWGADTYSRESGAAFNERLSYIILNIYNNGIGLNAVREVVKRDPSVITEMFDLSERFKTYGRLIGIDKAIDIVLNAVGHEKALEVFRQNPKGFLLCLWGIFNQGIMSEAALNYIASTFNVEDKDELDLRRKRCVLKHIGEFELECLARESQWTNDFARQFSYDTDKVVLVLPIKSNGVYYAWKMEDPIQAQLKDPEEIKKFERGVQQKQSLGLEPLSARLQTAQEWIGAGYLDWYVHVGEIDVPSTSTGGRLSQGLKMFKGIYGKAISAVNPNILFVDASSYNRFPESFAHVRNLVVRNYPFFVAGHASIPDRKFKDAPGRTLSNSTDIDDALDPRIVSNEYFRNIRRELAYKEHGSAAICLNPARKTHGQREHSLCRFDDYQDITPDLLAVVREEIQGLNGPRLVSRISEDPKRPSLKRIFELLEYTPGEFREALNRQLEDTGKSISQSYVDELIWLRTKITPYIQRAAEAAFQYEIKQMTKRIIKVLGIKAEILGKAIAPDGITNYSSYVNQRLARSSEIKVAFWEAVKAYYTKSAPLRIKYFRRVLDETFDEFRDSVNFYAERDKPYGKTQSIRFEKGEYAPPLAYLEAAETHTRESAARMIREIRYRTGDQGQEGFAKAIKPCFEDGRKFIQPNLSTAERKVDKTNRILDILKAADVYLRDWFVERINSLRHKAGNPGVRNYGRMLAAKMPDTKAFDWNRMVKLLNGQYKERRTFIFDLIEAMDKLEAELDGTADELPIDGPGQVGGVMTAEIPLAEYEGPGQLGGVQDNEIPPASLGGDNGSGEAIEELKAAFREKQAVDVVITGLTRFKGTGNISGLSVVYEDSSGNRIVGRIPKSKIPSVYGHFEVHEALKHPRNIGIFGKKVEVKVINPNKWDNSPLFSFYTDRVKAPHTEKLHRELCKSYSLGKSVDVKVVDIMRVTHTDRFLGFVVDFELDQEERLLRGFIEQKDIDSAILNWQHYKTCTADDFRNKILTVKVLRSDRWASGIPRFSTYIQDVERIDREIVDKLAALSETDNVINVKVVRDEYHEAGGEFFRFRVKYESESLTRSVEGYIYKENIPEDFQKACLDTEEHARNVVGQKLDVRVVPFGKWQNGTPIFSMFVRGEKPIFEKDEPLQKAHEDDDILQELEDAYESEQTVVVRVDGVVSHRGATDVSGLHVIYSSPSLRKSISGYISSRDFPSYSINRHKESPEDMRRYEGMDLAVKVIDPDMWTFGRPNFSLYTKGMRLNWDDDLLEELRQANHDGSTVEITIEEILVTRGGNKFSGMTGRYISKKTGKNLQVYIPEYKIPRSLKSYVDGDPYSLRRHLGKKMEAMVLDPDRWVDNKPNLSLYISEIFSPRESKIDVIRRLYKDQVTFDAKITRESFRKGKSSEFTGFGAVCVNPTLPKNLKGFIPRDEIPKSKMVLFERGIVGLIRNFVGDIVRVRIKRLSGGKTKSHTFTMDFKEDGNEGAPSAVGSEEETDTMVRNISDGLRYQKITMLQAVNDILYKVLPYWIQSYEPMLNAQILIDILRKALDEGIIEKRQKPFVDDLLELLTLYHERGDEDGVADEVKEGISSLYIEYVAQPEMTNAAGNADKIVIDVYNRVMSDPVRAAKRLLHEAIPELVFIDRKLINTRTARDILRMSLIYGVEDEVLGHFIREAEEIFNAYEDSNDQTNFIQELRYLLYRMSYFRVLIPLCKLTISINRTYKVLREKFDRGQDVSQEMELLTRLFKAGRDVKSPEYDLYHNTAQEYFFKLTEPESKALRDCPEQIASLQHNCNNGMTGAKGTFEMLRLGGDREKVARNLEWAEDGFRKYEKCIAAMAYLALNNQFDDQYYDSALNVLEEVREAVSETGFDLESAYAQLVAACRFNSSLLEWKQSGEPRYAEGFQTLHKSVTTLNAPNQGLILYADDVIENGIMLDIEDTFKELFNSNPGSLETRIFVYSRNEANGVILSRMIKRAYLHAKVYQISESDINEGRVSKLDDLGEMKELAQFASRRGVKNVMSLIRGPLRLEGQRQVMQEDTDDIARFARDNNIPIILLRHEQALYSLAEALVIPHNAGKQNKGWVYFLDPIKEFDIEYKYYQKYLENLNLLQAA